MIARILLMSTLASAVSFADLSTAKAEPNLERRSEKAILNAQPAIDRARTAYKEGDASAETAAWDEVRQSIELCKTSLDQSGKDPRRSPKYFKKAEQELRKILRRLDSIRVDRGVDDREPVDKLIALSRRVHEELLVGIMGKRK